MKHLARALSALFISVGALVAAPVASAQTPDWVSWNDRAFYASSSWLFSDPFGTPPGSGVAHDYDTSYLGQRYILEAGNAEDEAIARNLEWWEANVAPFDEYTYAVGSTETSVVDTYDPGGANRPIWGAKTYIYRSAPGDLTYACEFHDRVWVSACPPEHMCVHPPRNVVAWNPEEGPSCGAGG
jgi:hypothetical protein